MPLMHREEFLVILSPAVSSPEQLKKIDLFRLPLIVEDALEIMLLSPGHVTQKV